MSDEPGALGAIFSSSKPIMMGSSKLILANWFTFSFKVAESSKFCRGSSPVLSFLSEPLSSDRKNSIISSIAFPKPSSRILFSVE